MHIFVKPLISIIAVYIGEETRQIMLHLSAFVFIQQGESDSM